MDHPRDQTKKHSYRSLLRTSRRKGRQNEIILQHNWNTNPAKTEETRYNRRWRPQRKAGYKPTEGKTKPIKKQRDHEKTTAKNWAHPNKHQRWPRNMDQGQQKKIGGKINHRLHTHLQRHQQTHINCSGWGRPSQSERKKNETDHNTIITTIATNLPRKKNHHRKMEIEEQRGMG